MLSSPRYLPLSLLVLPIVIGVSACGDNPAQTWSALDPSGATKIVELAPKAEGTSVVVQGKVIAIAPMVKHTAYEVQDASGVIWVFTQRKAPQRHAQVKVHGVIRSTNGERYIDQR
jgi:hypothetical protein